jgi:hypothetical protein
MKIQGVIEDDLSFVEDHFDKVASKHPVEKMGIIDIDDDNVFVKKDGKIFDAVNEGKGKSGRNLLTLGVPIEKIPEEKIKKLRERIVEDLEAIEDGGGNDDEGTEYKNPFLPRLDELGENGGEE